MSNQIWAMDALEIARASIRQFKSSNKRGCPSNTSGGFLNQSRRVNAEKNITRMRQYGTAMNYTVEKYGSEIISRDNMKAGNCFEYACAAAAAVIGRGGTAHVISVDDPGDHLFCVVGKMNFDNINLTDVTKYGKNIDGDDIWICDPWANIACPAKNYHKQFRAKMKKWYTEGKEISFEGEWISPLDYRWIASVFFHRKKKVYF